MSNSISNLLIRNLHDVFGENDPARRRAAIDELWAGDGVFYDPSRGAIRGRDEIDRVAGAVKATHPDFRYQVTAAPRNIAMQGWFHGYRDALVKCRLTLGGISSSCGTAGSLRFTYFSTSGPDGWIEFEAGQAGSRKGNVAMETVLRMLIERERNL